MIANEIKTKLAADATLAAIVGEKIIPLKLPQIDTLPCVTYFLINKLRDESKDGTELFRSRYQFDCWAKTYSDGTTGVIDIADALTNSLGRWQEDTATVQIKDTFIESERESYDDETQVYGVTIDIIFIHS